MFDAIVGFFMFVIAMVVFFGAVVVAVLIQNSGGSNNSNYSEDDEDDYDDESIHYIIEATNNTNLGYMKVGSSEYETSAIRAAESYLRNGRSGYRARVVEVVNGKRRGIVWTS